MPSVGAAFVWRMEAVLDLYAQPYDARLPTVCFDEVPYQLIAEKYAEVHSSQGVRYDYEYERAGTCNLFMMFEPLAGWRHVEVSPTRTKLDFAACIRALVEVHYPEAERIRLVCDNLNTHTPASFYAAFEPAEARRLAERIEFVYTPKHASWLNMAEIEISVMQEQCTGRRLGSRGVLEQEVGAWERTSNASGRTVRWSFTTASARERLKRLYPSISE